MIERLLAEAERLGFPTVHTNAGAIVGEAQWREKLPGLYPGQVAEVVNQLNVHAGRAARLDGGARVTAEFAAARERLEGPQGELEAREAARMRAEASAAVARHEAQRGERVEDLLVEIRDLLKGRR